MTASSCTASSTCCNSPEARRSSSTTRRTGSATRRPRKSSRPTTACSASFTRSRASGPGRRRWRSSTSSSSVRPSRSRRGSRSPTCPRSRRSSPPRSRASRPASSRRPRVSSRAQGARLSTSCARARVSASQASSTLPRSFVREARKRVAPKKERIRPIIERLAAEHADAAIALTFRSPLELLISVMLSAQTTDVNVNRVTEKLFVKYRKPEDYLAVPQEELEQDVYATGFYRQKTRSIRGAMRVLLEEFDGEVPTRIDELLRLPGVARKTANVVAAELGEAQGIVVDTHVRRLSQRLGLTKREDPVKIERDLVKLVPREDWARFPHLMIWHGRRVCDARKPRCEDCVLVDLCPSSRV